MKELKLGSLFDGLYQISEDGRLFSERTGKWLRPSTDRYGYQYYVVSINGTRFTVKAHRAVAECYIENPENKPTVDHIDGDRKNNSVSNLRWATHKEQQHNDRTVLKVAEAHAKTDYRAMGEKRNFGRKTVSVYRNGVKVGTYPSLKAAVGECGGNYAKASECANGKRKTTGGCRYCYD